jgi:hypothetical protein
VPGLSHKPTITRLNNYTLKAVICILVSFASVKPVVAQNTDSTDYYDELFGELDAFLDSMMKPRTMFIVNVNAGYTYLNYQSSSTYYLEAEKEITLAPSVGYFHKSGLGLNVSTTIVDDGTKWNPYQFMVTGSYDYLKHENFLAGIGVTRFITADSLAFYTSPLQNEAAVYFTWRKWRIRPSVSASYGWGSRKAYEERSEYITSLRLRPNGYTRVDTEESIKDFTVSASVRRDFYWLDVIGKNNMLRVTPQLIFTSGTQKFGFNQSSKTYGYSRRNGSSELYSADNFYLDDQLYFQPIALTGTLKTELTFGKFFIQPQVSLDYYFPAEEKKMSTVFNMNVGAIF